MFVACGYLWLQTGIESKNHFIWKRSLPKKYLTIFLYEKNTKYLIGTINFVLNFDS